MDDKNKINELVNNKIWVTKKIRMGAEQRRKNLKSNFFILFNLITALTLIVSILDMTISKKNEIINFSIIGVLFSVILVTLSLIITNFDFDKEANEFRRSYLKLDRLESICNDSKNLKYSKILKKYNDILWKYINHSKMDFIYFKISQEKSGNRNFNITLIERIENFFCNYILILLIFMLSFFIAFLFCYYSGIRLV